MDSSSAFSTLELGPPSPPLVIAEMSANHNHSLERALEVVDAAAEAGADAIKIQTYTAETMTLDVDAPGFRIDNPSSPWFGRTLFDLYDEAHTPWDWHAAIFERAANLGLVAFSTPFDDSAVDFLESLDVPAYKIASFELTDTPLIRKVAATGKTVLISTGMGTDAEIESAVACARAHGSGDVVLLKCTSSYPAPPSDLNLATMSEMARRFDCLVGLSDHTMDSVAAIASVALGSAVIEKHLTLSRSDGGVDSSFSLEPEEFAALVRDVRTAWHALGTTHFGPTDAEIGSLPFRRSLYVVEDIAAGEALTAANVRSIRPGYGMPPGHLDRVLGARASRDLRRGTPLTIGDFEE